ncbi:hypothetical protein GEV33_006196 [Tenebrio molitor]|uniref:Endonuclease/exonuclease/phosphatase domain-containing protein n=1 Tax=Tenebrio molitor TaxID=7067 RepID=A0A8J6HD36_TENMO|nr:hypothetical protein GEV33_006196 [Tenebrio molitor]
MIALAEEETGLKNRLKTLCSQNNIEWPLTRTKDVDKWKLGVKQRELRRWSSQSSHGKSVQSLTDDKIANAWLYNKKLLKPSNFITALKMRANVTADKVALNKARPQADLKCRKCKVQIETLGHILGQCILTKDQRIRRHNEIRDLVLEQVIKRDPQAAVTKEPTIGLPTGENLKPDLVIKSRDRVFVVDVTVRHEDGDYLTQGRTDKITKYAPLLPVLQDRMGAGSGKVLPVVVGTRGAMPKETVEVLKQLKIIDRKTLLTMSLIALRSSIIIYHTFMDYDARPRPMRGINRPHRYGWSASQDVERVWREADILAAELGWKHGFVSSWADTSTWFPWAGDPQCVRGSLAKFQSHWTHNVWITDWILNTKITWHRHMNNKVFVQCHRCQKWGHATANCHARPRCLKCAEEHLTRECPIGRTHTPRCANCSGTHTANNIECPVYIQKLDAAQEKRTRRNNISDKSKLVPAPPPARNAWEKRTSTTGHEATPTHNRTTDTTIGDNPQAQQIIWNANSLQQKTGILKEYLTREKIDLIMISETCLKPTDKIEIGGYKIHRNDRTNAERASGGVALIIKEDIPHATTKIKTTQIEQVGVKLKNNLHIFSIYNRPYPNKLFKPDLDKLCGSANKVLIGGDFNAKHPDWNCARSNPSGTVLKAYADENDIIINFPNQPTHYPDNGMTPTTIDLYLAKNVTITDGPFATADLDSDHNPITVQIPFQERQTRTRQATKQYKTDWKNIKISELDEKYCRRNLTSPNEVKMVIKKLPNNKVPGLDNITNRMGPRNSDTQAKQKHSGPRKLPTDKPPIRIKQSSRKNNKQPDTKIRQQATITQDEQFGFRSEHDTTQQISRIVTEVINNYNKDNVTQMTILDIQKAFDRVWVQGLIAKLMKTKLPINLRCD